MAGPISARMSQCAACPSIATPMGANGASPTASGDAGGVSTPVAGANAAPDAATPGGSRTIADMLRDAQAQAAAAGTRWGPEVSATGTTARTGPATARHYSDEALAGMFTSNGGAFELVGLDARGGLVRTSINTYIGDGPKIIVTSGTARHGFDRAIDAVQVMHSLGAVEIQPHEPGTPMPTLHLPDGSLPRPTPTAATGSTGATYDAATAARVLADARGGTVVEATAPNGHTYYVGAIFNTMPSTYIEHVPTAALPYDDPNVISSTRDDAIRLAHETVPSGITWFVSDFATQGRMESQFSNPADAVANIANRYGATSFRTHVPYEQHPAR